MIPVWYAIIGIVVAEVVGYLIGLDKGSRKCD